MSSALLSSRADRSARNKASGERQLPDRSTGLALISGQSLGLQRHLESGPGGHHRAVGVGSLRHGSLHTRASLRGNPFEPDAQNADDNDQGDCSRLMARDDCVELTSIGDRFGKVAKGDTHAESAVLRDRFLARGVDAGRHGAIGPEGQYAPSGSAQTAADARRASSTTCRPTRPRSTPARSNWS